MFRAEIWKLPEFFIWKFSFFAGKILNIFELACFRNVDDKFWIPYVPRILAHLTLYLVLLINSNKVEPDQTHVLWRMIWVYILCLDLSVQTRRVCTVVWSNRPYPSVPLEILDTVSLRKYAYWNILKILPPKNEKNSDKYSDIFHISAQNIDCGYSLDPPRRGGCVV